MFDRCPDPVLVADLVAAQSAPPVEDPAVAAVDLLEQAMAWNRVASWVEAHRLETLRLFAAARTAADVDVAGMPDDLAVTPAARAARARLRATLKDEAGRFAAEEVGLALNISPTSAARQLQLAEDLHGVHRQLGDALQQGQVSPFVAMMVATATRRLPDQARALLDETVTADAMQLPTGKAIEAARNRALALDEYAEHRARSAQTERRVYHKPLDDGLGMLGAVLAAEDAATAYQHLDKQARALRSAGDPRSLDQLRCAILLHRIHHPDSPPPGHPDHPVEDGSEPAGTASAPADAQQSPPQPVRHRVDLQVVISLTTLLGLDSDPAYLHGYGSITSTVVQRILDTADITLHRLLCDPITGAVMVTDPTRYTPSNGLRHATGCRDRHCRMPVCQARIGHLDHIRARIDGGLTTTDNLQGLCERSHLAKHHPGWTVTGNADTVLTWHTPTGHTYHSLPPPALGHGTGPPAEIESPLDVPTWLTHQQQLRRILQQPAAPSHQEQAP